MEEKLFEIICELIESQKELNSKLSPKGSNVKPNVYPITVTGETPQKLAGENSRRGEIWIHNADETSDLFIAPDVPEVGPDLYSLRIAPLDTVIMNGNNYSQIYQKKIVGFWESGVASDAKAMITEFSVI